MLNPVRVGSRSSPVLSQCLGGREKVGVPNLVVHLVTVLPQQPDGKQDGLGTIPGLAFTCARGVEVWDVGRNADQMAGIHKEKCTRV